MTSNSAAKSSRLQCREIMTTNVSTASTDQTISAVAALMKSRDVGAVPVVDADGVLVGILTDRDIVVRGVAENKTYDTKVSDVMSQELATVLADDFAFEAARLMGERQVRRIPVVDADGKLQGIIAMADIALQMEDELEIAEVLEDISSGAAFWGKK